MKLSATDFASEAGVYRRDRSRRQQRSTVPLGGCACAPCTGHDVHPRTGHAPTQETETGSGSNLGLGCWVGSDFKSGLGLGY